MKAEKEKRKKGTREMPAKFNFQRKINQNSILTYSAKNEVTAPVEEHTPS